MIISAPVIPQMTRLVRFTLNDPIAYVIIMKAARNVAAIPIVVSVPISTSYILFAMNNFSPFLSASDVLCRVFEMSVRLMCLCLCVCDPAFDLISD